MVVRQQMAVRLSCAIADGPTLMGSYSVLSASRSDGIVQPWVPTHGGQFVQSAAAQRRQGFGTANTYAAAARLSFGATSVPWVGTHGCTIPSLRDEGHKSG